jgi:hypothetical protein
MMVKSASSRVSNHEASDFSIEGPSSFETAAKVGSSG